jgi:hypothetical protein
MRRKREAPSRTKATWMKLHGTRMTVGTNTWTALPQRTMAKLTT